MSFTKTLPFVAFVLAVAASTFTSIHATKFVVTNNCGETIWAASTKGGQRLDPGQAWSLDLNPDTQRIWGRTKCNFDANGRGGCETGDCGGALVCSLSGQPPLTLAEFTLRGGNNNDYYDISVIDGYNVGMSFKPTNPNCPSLRCTDARCPDAYLFPTDDTKTKGCPTGSTDYNIVFCPN